jgi:predicted ATPase/class 3 adenylate cyclase
MMSEASDVLPSGTVTFVFTDIEGSSRLFREFGDGYVRLLERHNELLRGVWLAHSGHEVKTEGDAFFVAFGNTTAALRACVAGQEALAAEPWPAGVTVRVRMGVHAGLAYPRGDDYVAYAVHQAARVVSAAHGGQILTSASTAGVEAASDRVGLRSLGRYRLRDFDEPVELLQVDRPGQEQRFPAVRAVPADGHNLVRPRTAFVGRARELEELDDLVATVRLITIAGTGGLGKTRLATEWGLATASSWRDGVWMIDLSAVSDAMLLPNAVGDALGVSLAGAGDVWAEVVAHLVDRSEVLIFDNCEHLIDAVADRVNDLLDQCPELKVIATSREPLKIRDERVWRLGPLEAAGDGVALFIGRAQDARHGFVPDPHEIEPIAAICRRLDGLPLAIELAAARTAQFRVHEILNGLDEQHLLMRQRDRHVPERQRTMRAVLDWSWQLLDPDEQHGLAALGVFAGSFSLDTATIALATDPGTAADTLWSLVDKSLVAIDPSANDTRYRCLHTIRTYARNQLDDGEASAVASRLARHFLNRFGPQIVQAQQHVHERTFEIDNVRGLIALLARSDQEAAQLLACAVLDPAVHTSMLLDEGLALLASLPAKSVARIGLLVRCAGQATNRGDERIARSLLDEAIVLRRELGGEAPWDELYIESELGFSVLQVDPHAALDIATDSLARVATASGRARIFTLHALAAGELGDHAAAYESSQQVLAESLARGSVTSAMPSYCNLAEYALRLGNPTEAAAQQLRALDIALQVGSELVIAVSTIIAARLAAASYEWGTATRLCANALASFARLDFHMLPTDGAMIDQLLENASNVLGPDTFAEFHGEGAALAPDDAIALTKRTLTDAATL